MMKLKSKKCKLSIRNYLNITNTFEIQDMKNVVSILNHQIKTAKTLADVNL